MKKLMEVKVLIFCLLLFTSLKADYFVLKSDYYIFSQIFYDSIEGFFKGYDYRNIEIDLDGNLKSGAYNYFYINGKRLSNCGVVGQNFYFSGSDYLYYTPRRYIDGGYYQNIVVTTKSGELLASKEFLKTLRGWDIDINKNSGFIYAVIPGAYSEYRKKYYVAKFTKELDLIKCVSVCLPNSSYKRYNKSFFLRPNELTVIINGNNFDFNDSKEHIGMFQLVLNENLEIEKKVHFGIDELTGFVHSDIEVKDYSINNNSVTLLFGIDIWRPDYMNYDSDSFGIIQYNNDMNIKYGKKFESLYDVYRIEPIFLIKDNEKKGFLIGLNNVYLKSDNTWYYRPVIIKTDNNFNIIWSRECNFSSYKFQRITSLTSTTAGLAFSTSEIFCHLNKNGKMPEQSSCCVDISHEIKFKTKDLIIHRSEDSWDYQEEKEENIFRNTNVINEKYYFGSRIIRKICNYDTLSIECKRSVVNERSYLNGYKLMIDEMLITIDQTITSDLNLIKVYGRYDNESTFLLLDEIQFEEGKLNYQVEYKYKYKGDYTLFGRNEYMVKIYNNSGFVVDASSIEPKE